MYFAVTDIPRYMSDNLIDVAVMFAYDYLGLDPNISSDVYFDPELDLCGLCNYDFAERRADIFVKPGLSSAETIRTIFHEFVHVLQQDEGSLEEDPDSDGWFWIGVDYSLLNTPYNDLPWEVEAHQLERLMYQAFTEKLKTAAPNLLTELSESDIV